MASCWFCREEISDNTEVCPWCGRRQQKSQTPQTGRPQIMNVRLFVKRPSRPQDVFSDIPTITYGSLPEGFIEGADRMLGLDGELVAYIKKERGVFFPKDIGHVEDIFIESFLSKQAESEVWDAYHATGSRSGKHYYLLVDFHVQPALPLNTVEVRHRVYLEHAKLLSELASQYALEHPEASSGVIPEYIEVLAHRWIRCKYGISEIDMVRIRSDAIINGWDLKFSS